MPAPEEPLRAVLRLGSGRTERDPRRNDNSILEPALELGVGDRLRVLRMRGDDGDERVEMRVGAYDPSEVRNGEHLIETTLRLKSAEDEVGLELGIEPLSTPRPDDRRPQVRGRLFETPAPYLVLFGDNARPIFFVSNWTAKNGEGDEPSLDLWDGGETSLFRAPSPERDAHEARQDGGIRTAEEDIKALRAEVDQLRQELRLK